MTDIVLVIGAVWPESNSSAAGQNMAALLQHFHCKGYTIHFASAAAESPHIDAQIKEICSLHAIVLNDSTFNNLVAAINPDVVIFDRFMTEEQFSARVRHQCPEALHILNTEDLHSLRHARHEAVKQGLPVKRAALNNAFSQREIAAILRSDISLIISAAEYQLLTDYFKVPAAQLVLFPLQQPLHSHAHSARFDERQHFISVGNFRHAPNWDAVLQLKQMWLAIKARIPSAELHIYGAYPPKKATQLHNHNQGFLVKGWAADIAGAMASARVCLAPLRFGAGIKGKLLTAAQHATPSITTAIGAEGLATVEDWPGAVAEADEHDAFVQHACTLYQSEADWLIASNKARQLTQSYQQLQQQSVTNLFTTISHIRPQIDAFRKELFLHSLLWHHSLRASQFMSQWIEAKNR